MNEDQNQSPDPEDIPSSQQDHAAHSDSESTPSSHRESAGSPDPEGTPSGHQDPADSTGAESTPSSHLDPAAIADFHRQMTAIRERIGRVIIGQQSALDQLLVGLLADGHILLEGVPGIAKTLLAKSLAQSLDLVFRRIQFTPDLMPSDVIGTSVFDMEARRFVFQKGPVFGQVILIDEINRAPAKTQAALFEVMEERQITYDGQTYVLPEPFLVVATQNPIEQEGTYRLPEAQLDRFLFRTKMDYPSLKEEQTLLRRFREAGMRPSAEGQKPVLDAAGLLACRQLVQRVHCTDALCDYIAALVHATRDHGSLYLGASPRASLGIMHAAKAMALLEGRDFVIPEDVQAAALPVLNHRILLTSERELEGVQSEAVVRDILSGLDVPR